MTPDDTDLSQRERRRQQFEKTKPAINVNASALRKWAAPLVVVALVGAVIGIVAFSDDGDADAFGCNAHYHFTFDLFLDQDKVALNPPGDTKFVDTVGHDLHMHESTSTGAGLNLIHAHFAGGTNFGLHPENCFSYDDVEDMLSMDVAMDEVTLRAIHGDSLSGDYPVDDDNPITVWGQGWDDADWVPLDLATLGDKVPPMSSRLAILYGEQPDDVQAFLDENATPFPVTTYPPSDVEGDNPPHYLSFDELTDKP